MILTIKTSKNVEIFINGTSVNNESIELSNTQHHLRCEQNHYLYKKTWWLKLFNPFLFFGYVFFKEQFLSHVAYNSEAAVIEFDIVPKNNNAFLEIDLEYQYVNNNYTQQYSVLSIADCRGLKIEHFKRCIPSSVFKARWLLLRLLPSALFAITLSLITVFGKISVSAPIVYIVLAILNSIRLIKNRPIK